MRPRADILPPCRPAGRRLAWWLVLVAVVVLPARGQLEFSGYVATFPTYQWTSPEVARYFGLDTEQFLTVTRLRLRPLVSLWSDTHIGLEYEVSCLTYSSFLPKDVRLAQPRGQVVDLTWTIAEGDHVSAVHFVDRLYIRQGFGAGDLIVGRQRIALGTGRVWNPTDLFNPLNPTTYAKLEKDGVDAAMARFHLGNFTDLTLVVNPERDWDTVNVGGRFRTNFAEFDVSVMSGVFRKRLVAGCDFAGNLLDAGVRAEAIYSTSAQDHADRYVKLIAGADYQFTPELYALIEYHFNGQGMTDPMQYDLARLATGEVLNLSRNYLALQGSYLVHPLVTTSLSAIVNLDDGSSYLGGLVSYSVSDEISVSLGVRLFPGQAYDEYWYYPDGLYAKADLYF